MISRSTDLELVRRALRGVADARRELVERLTCASRFLAAMNARAGTPLNRDELLDEIQEVHSLAWSQLARFLGRSRLETWIYGFCLNRMRTTLRRKARRTEVASLHASDPALPATLDPSRSLLDDPRSELGAYLRHVTPVQARILELHFLEERGIPEIALGIGLSESAVKKHYQRALQRLSRVFTVREDIQ